MKKRLAALAAVAALTTAGLLGATAGPAAADPPAGGGWIWMGSYPTLDSCVAAAKANAPAHGPVYLCEARGWYQLWMH